MSGGGGGGAVHDDGDEGGGVYRSKLGMLMHDVLDQLTGLMVHLQDRRQGRKRS